MQPLSHCGSSYNCLSRSDTVACCWNVKKANNYPTNPAVTTINYRYNYAINPAVTTINFRHISKEDVLVSVFVCLGCLLSRRDYMAHFLTSLSKQFVENFRSLLRALLLLCILDSGSNVPSM